MAPCYHARVMASKKGGKEFPRFLADQKVGIFIDAENVEMSGYNIYSGRTDYKKLLDAIGGQRRVIRIIYYKPIHKEIAEDFRKFWHDQGGEIKQPEKNADSFLTIDVVTLAEKIDVAVLVSGDKDYLPLLWYLKSRGCKGEVWSFPETTAAMMKDAADQYFSMDDRYIIKDSPRKENSRSSRGHGRQSKNGH